MSERRWADPSGLTGWADDDHSAALSAYGLSYHKLGLGWPPAPDPPTDARAFFEERFWAATAPTACHFTGYYEPELAGRSAPDAIYRHPLYAAPAGLSVSGTWHSRREIAAGDLLAGRELVWLDSAIEAFLAQVQGSVRVRLEDGRVLRLGFAGKNGHDYRSIGQELIRRGEIRAEVISADAIRAWYAAHPEDVADLLAHNPSFVFFRSLDLPPDSGPLGSAGVPLTPLRSLAADAEHIAPGSPVWVECGSVQALLIAQDTGSAIRGPERADIYCGTGSAAGRMASALNRHGRISVLTPRGGV
jgi:membrane-bound lytic murein transglycosylase A